MRVGGGGGGGGGRAKAKMDLMVLKICVHNKSSC